MGFRVWGLGFRVSGLGLHGPLIWVLTRGHLIYPVYPYRGRSARHISEEELTRAKKLKTPKPTRLTSNLNAGSSSALRRPTEETSLPQLPGKQPAAEFQPVHGARVLAEAYMPAIQDMPLQNVQSACMCICMCIDNTGTCVCI